jgi:hypothetical protein
MSSAYDTALASLHDHGQPEVVREIIAKRIIAAALKGERDPERLRQQALSALSRIARSKPQALPGSFAILTAFRRASSLAKRFVVWRLPGSSSK